MKKIENPVLPIDEITSEQDRCPELKFVALTQLAAEEESSCYVNRDEARSDSMRTTPNSRSGRPAAKSAWPAASPNLDGTRIRTRWLERYENRYSKKKLKSAMPAQCRISVLTLIAERFSGKDLLQLHDI